jgi:hypothetical protein
MGLTESVIPTGAQRSADPALSEVEWDLPLVWVGNRLGCAAMSLILSPTDYLVISTPRQNAT